MVSKQEKAAVQTTRPIYKPVAVDLLDFDATNPRFGGCTETLSQGQLQQLLEEVPHYARELVPSLVENGFIAYEPLVVKQEGDRYVVIEGNRRLAAVRYILNHPAGFSDEVRNKFDRIPALVFPSRGTESTQDDAIRLYLGVHHLFGFRAWPLRAKLGFWTKTSRQQKILRNSLAKWEYRLPSSNVTSFHTNYGSTQRSPWDPWRSTIFGRLQRR